VADQDTAPTPADVEPPAPASTHVVAEHPEVGQAVIARTALDLFGEGGWQYVRDAASADERLAPIPPVEPAEAEPGEGAFDPSAHHVPEVLAYLAEVDEPERQRVLTAERAGKNRQTILDGHQEA